MSRNIRPINDQAFFHICNKSIAGFEIFTKSECVNYFLSALDYYRFPTTTCLAQALRQSTHVPHHLLEATDSIRIYAYCIMPTHYHLLISTKSKQALAAYMSIVENSYTRYFNLKTGRKGPLWQSRFRRIAIQSNSQLLHVMRYIHLNPVVARLADTPELWEYSSYNDMTMSDFWIKTMSEVSIKKPQTYAKFVNNLAAFQRKVPKLRNHLIIQ